MKKFIFLIIIVVLAGVLVWAVKNEKFFAEKNPLQESENSLQASVNSVHQTDNFYNIQVECPQFKNIDENFNKKISDLVLGEIDNFKKEAKDNWEARKATADAENPVPENPEESFDFIASWKPAQLNNEYISFVIDIYYYTGGAHGIEEANAFNYDIKQKKEISIFGFLNSSQPALEKLAELAANDITSQLKSEGMSIDGFLKQMIEEGTEPTEKNYQNFTFNYNSLTIYFQQYQVAPGAVGSPTVTFYKDTLEDNSIKSDYFK